MKLPPTHNRDLKQELRSGFGAGLLAKLGWREGEGLGKDRTGTTEAIVVKQKLDARGIGAERSGLGEDWGSTWWERAFNAKAEGVTAAADDAIIESHGAGSDSDDSDDSDSDAGARGRPADRSLAHRDGTTHTGSAFEHKLAKQLAKDPWGRWGGRDGKMARIAKQEAATANRVVVAPGAPSAVAPLPTRPPVAPPRSKKAPLPPAPPAVAAAAEAAASRLAARGAAQQPAEITPPVVAFAPRPAGWWGASLFVSVGAMGARGTTGDAAFAPAAPGLPPGERGFSEAQQEALALAAHASQRTGRGGIGIGSRVLKIGGVAFGGTKRQLGDDDGDGGHGDGGDGKMTQSEAERDGADGAALKREAKRTAKKAKAKRASSPPPWAELAEAVLAGTGAKGLRSGVLHRRVMDAAGLGGLTKQSVERRAAVEALEAAVARGHRFATGGGDGRVRLAHPHMG